MRYVELGKTGEKIPVLGQGLWGVSRLKGFFKGSNYYEIIKSALRKGIELGMTHIDTAEFYGLGKAEKVLGELIKEYPRDNLFITSKLFPIHFRKNSMKKAAIRSLKRLGIDYLDLYLIHWPSKFISIKKEMNVLEALVNNGMTRYIGVSNFSVKQFKKAQDSLKKEELVNNQLHINITNQRYIHKSLSYYQRNGITVTAYSPLAHKGYTKLGGKIREVLENFAIKYNSTIQQIAIAWLINHENIITIPKAFNRDHVEDNAKAADINFLQEDLQQLYKFGEFH
ncbi:MAG: aldo/keto reductase [Candidatus Thorarchaeota archaeon]